MIGLGSARFLVTLHWMELYASGQLRFALGLHFTNPFRAQTCVLCDWLASSFVEFANSGFPHPRSIAKNGTERPANDAKLNMLSPAESA
jgi:hypothetical protein